MLPQSLSSLSLSLSLSLISCKKFRGQSNGAQWLRWEIRGNFTRPLPSKTPRNYLNWYQEFSMLKAQYDSLQHSQSHLLGEDLGSLSLRELQKLERQVESALSQIRKKKTQILLDEMDELKKKLEAAHTSDKATKGSWEARASVRGSAPVSARPSQSNAVDSEPVLEIGFHHVASTEEANPRNTPAENNFMQNWAL